MSFSNAFGQAFPEPNAMFPGDGGFYEGAIPNIGGENTGLNQTLLPAPDYPAELIDGTGWNFGSLDDGFNLNLGEGMMAQQPVPGQGLDLPSQQDGNDFFGLGGEYPGAMPNFGAEMTNLQPLSAEEVDFYNGAGMLAPANPYVGAIVNNGEEMAAPQQLPLPDFVGASQEDGAVYPAPGVPYAGTIATGHEDNAEHRPISLPELYEQTKDRPMGSYRRRYKLGQRKSPKERVSSRKSPNEAMATPAPGSTPSPNRRGQKTGLPQAFRAHKRHCEPFVGCKDNCPLKAQFPDVWEKKRAKKCKGKKRIAALEGYEDLQNELWVHYCPNKGTEGAFAGDDNGHKMPHVEEPARPKKIRRTQLG